LHHGDDVEAPPEGSKPILKPAQRVDEGFDARAIHFYTVLVGAEATNPERVAMSSIA
jgi:hypothetical protein